ncbi:c-type cytochrome [Tsuneonella mangrovi]|uniref:c-type cytochrome n=1 Tax=Tsuneonella mangrovi TaxID=1982042 RepID=UPI000BA2B923|nr:c-type cytochrome [Tsuneonella mangrovi]
MLRIRSTLSVLAITLALAACGKSPSDTATAATGEASAAPAASTVSAASVDSGATAAAEVTPAAATADPPAMVDPVAAGGKPPAAFVQCRACHSTKPGQTLIGPSLAGIYGTKAGEVAGFRFSDAMKKSGLTWDDASLDKFLESPMTVVPGTKMSFYGVKNAAQRQQIIDYLKTL